MPSGKSISSSKSGRFRTFNTNISKYIQWPQENVFVGASRRPLSYDELNPQQLLLGHLITAMAPENTADKDNMIQYAIKLLRESIDGSYESSRGAHAIVLQELERGSVTWADTKKLDDIRTLYSRKVATTDNSKRPDRSPGYKKVVCSHFNKNKCIKNSDHVTNNILYRHVCAFCFKSTGKFYNHCESVCNRKAKNDVPDN